MKFKVGDRVKSKVFGEGTVVEVETGSLRRSILVQFDNTDGRLHDGNDVSKKRYKENRCYFYTNPENELEPIKPKTFTKSDLQDDDIVTYRNGKKRTVKGEKLVYKDGVANLLNRYNKDLTRKNGNTKEDIVKVERPENLQTVFEREEILDKAEKEYLSGVIRPFRNKVKGIVKEETSEGELYIVICTKNDADMNFPNLDNKDDYKNMEVGKMYTLEELGL